MAKVTCADIRNVVFCGHGAAGKTSLLDRLLTLTGTVKGDHSVDAGTSICDFDPEEKAHKYTIETKLAHFTHGGKRFNALDTPGYPDFIGQTIGAIHGVDNAAIVVNAHSGIEVNTRRVYQEAARAKLGRIIVLNKMDTDNIDFPALIENIRDMWGPGCVLLNVPLGSGADFKGVASVLHPPAKADGALLDPGELHTALIESIVEVDEAVMERYFEGKLPTDEELARLLQQSIAAGSLVPIVCCSVKTGGGLAELLDALAACTIGPDVIPRTAHHNGDTVSVKCDPAGPLVAQVFKTRVDPFVQKLSYVRVFSGTLKKDDQVVATTSRKGFKAGNVLELVGAESHPVESAQAGDIVALAKIEELHTNSSLGELSVDPIHFPTPMVGLAVSPKTRGDETKLSTALHKVVEEDPTFRLDHDAQTKEVVMFGMSELHLKIIQERLKRRDKIEVDTKDPKIPFRETIQAPAEGSYRHKKQTGGRGQFGEVHIRMFPFPRDQKPEDFATKDRFPQMKEFHFDASNHFLWVNSIVGGSIPGNFLPAVEKGFKERMARGVIAGHQVQDVCVEVHFGKYHDVDSSEHAFKTAGSMAFRNVFQEAHPCLLEPVVKMAITVPEAHVGDVYSDMSGRGGRVQGSDAAGGAFTTVFAEVPLREVTHYARTISSMTGGQGSFTMDFSHYDVMPPNVQQEIISKAKLHEEEEE